MSSEGSAEEEKLEVIFEAKEEVSSEEPPMEEWSSLAQEIPEENVKKLLYEQGLYSPGSGELCGKYIALSDSEVFRHPYYNYPSVLDPGIHAALVDPPPKVIYADDGQELYLATCKEMNQCPVRSFYRGLLESKINLSYYGVNPYGIRAMALALQYNKTVESLNLTDNFLNDDACFHLSEMLMANSTLAELNLSGCRIGPSGARRVFAGLQVNRSLKVLNLGRNQLGDEGMELLAKAVFSNIAVRNINLSCNSISGKGVGALAEAFETHNKFTHIDLSRNNLYSFPSGITNLLAILGENMELQGLNLSWNALTGPKIGSGIKNVCKSKNLRYIDLSYNKLSGTDTINNLIASLAKPRKMVSLDLSCNPLSTQDALLIIRKLKLKTVKLQQLHLNNVVVDANFSSELDEMRTMESKQNVIVNYGAVQQTFKPVGSDARDLLLNRIEFLTKKSKKHSVDIALVVMQLLKDKNDIMDLKFFIKAIRAAGASLDEDLFNEIPNVFPGPKSAKFRFIDIKAMVDFCQRKWPERKLPPTPPPEPEPEPKKKKGKGKNKDAADTKAPEPVKPPPVPSAPSTSKIETPADNIVEGEPELEAVVPAQE